MFAVYMMVDLSFSAPPHGARNSHLGAQSTLGSKRVKFLMYNKPWKTGSTSIAERLKKCLVPQQYKLLDFEKVAGHQSIIPVSPVLGTASGTNMFAVDHGLYNLAELEHIKERDDVDACYMTSVRDPVARVPSNAVQIVHPDADGYLSRPVTDDMREKVGRIICRGIEEFDPQYMVHYMVGIRAGSLPNLTNHQTKMLVGNIMSVYDIVLDETGRILHDSGRHECSDIRTCLSKDKHLVENAKLRNVHLPVILNCQSRMDEIVKEELVFYNEMKRLFKN
jgi:hypothetical protein